MIRSSCTAMLTLSILTAGLALGEEEAGPNQGKVSFSAGFDVTTQYLFRGIFQENQGSILQPWGELGFSLFESEGAIKSVGISFGTWNSIHNGPSSDGPFATGDWYESDWYAGVSVGLPGNLTFDGSYVNLLAPDVAGTSFFAEEFDLSLSYDDSGLWNLDIAGFEGLQPYVLYVVEVDGASDGAGNGGDSYLEIGISPSVNVINCETAPVTMTVPVTVGLSLDDYYESPLPPAGDGDDETFGFFLIGVDFSMPLSFVPSNYGAWSAHAGVNVVFLGDSTIDLYDASDSTNGTEVIGTFGIGFEY